MGGTAAGMRGAGLLSSVLFARGGCQAGVAGLFSVGVLVREDQSGFGGGGEEVSPGRSAKDGEVDPEPIGGIGGGGGGGEEVWRGANVLGAATVVTGGVGAVVPWGAITISGSIGTGIALVKYSSGFGVGVSTGELEEFSIAGAIPPTI